MPRDVKVGLLWRAEWDPPGPRGVVREACRLHGVFAAFARLGVEAEPVVYTDSEVESVRKQLIGLDGVLVWVNPIEDGLDRSRLDPLLREAATAGVWISAHPDVVLRMGTKEVLIENSLDVVGQRHPHLPDRCRVPRAATGVIWDADLLYRPKDIDGTDTYVLCEINVSSVFAIPDEAPAAIARLTLERLRGG